MSMNKRIVSSEWRIANREASLRRLALFATRSSRLLCRYPQAAADDVLTALAFLTEIERSRHGGRHVLRWPPGGTPAVGHGHHLVPVVRAHGHVRGLVDLIELGGVFRDKAVGLDEIGEHVAARPMASDPPGDLETALFDPPRAAHQSIDIGQLVSDMIERGSVVTKNRDAVVISAAAQELHHMGAVGEFESQHIGEERHLLFGARAVEDDMADLARTRAIEHHVWVRDEIA